ncbi:class I SAM-dependent methyltransferase [Pedobacter sp. BS3]|uniref:O-methyltransferase n=1 Tax=Pedobacter sp. BS3 TaxID=2567937 RepID=UPI0011ED22AD|nr:class I SAM-dependent methyltransferase [Pedobacter sp. BS3]TZF81687.1 class I SAM-dependent methyltransferase [Pedobacter sp. BS3]
MVNLQFVRNYLQHYFPAKTRHGVHSPFVYRLVDEVIYDTGAKPVYHEIEALRRQLLHDERSITVTDLGAGSHVNKNRTRQVKQIARHALKPPKLAQLIYRLAARSDPSTIIELGTCLGITTSYLSKAAPKARIISIEGCPQTSAIAGETLKQASAANVELLTGNFDTILPGIIHDLDRIDFMFIDGNHRKDATLSYFNWSLPKVHEDTILIFDDIYWSAGMMEAWQRIKDHPQVTVTVDLFWIGLVFFKTGQAKEHFKIRY